MRILVTGHRGNVGAPVAAHLDRLGHELAGLDRADGRDLLDAPDVRRAAVGCAAIVHLGCLGQRRGAELSGQGAVACPGDALAALA